MKTNIKRIITVSLSLIVATALCVGITVMGRANRRSGGVYAVSEEQTHVDVQHGEMTNILVLGLDSEAGLCDVMMLVGINKTDGTAAVMQIPRDTYAAYTGASYKKLNGAYSRLGGARQTAEFIGDAFGMPIHHYVCIDLDTFSDVVDTLGGVDVELPFNMYYNDPEQKLYINIERGQVHLDGEKAQQFVRYRSGYSDGDLGRIDTQKLFMSAFFEKLADEFSPVMAARLAATLDGVETDMGVSDMISLGVDALGMQSENIFMLTLPGKEAIASESGASYYVLSRDATSEVLHEYFGADGEFDAERKFLNSRYDSFEKIYGEYTEYRVSSVTDIVREGL